MAEREERARPGGNEDILGLLEGAREEQRQAIVSTAALTVVSAGAGTGKTHTLARRFAWLLASDPACRVDQILTLTFTQAAATEMRERIRATLGEWHAAKPDRLSHLRDAIDRLDEGYISTIHSFALRVIRESGLDLDLDPAAGLASRPLERDFWSDFEWNLRTLSRERIVAGLSESMRTLAREALDDPELIPVLEHYGAGTVARLAAAASETFGSMMVSPEDFARFDAEQEFSVRSQIAHACCGRWQAACDIWFGSVFPAVGDDLAKGDNALARELAECRAKWSVPANDGDACGFFADLILHGLSDLKARKLKGRIEDILGCSLTAYRRENSLVAEVSASLCHEETYAPAERTARRLLLVLAAIGWSSWENAKRRMGVLSFSDLVAGASAILRDNVPYAARFRHIMIDEFQDTDALQDSLAVSLRQGWAAMPEPESASRTLFIVGDIKQSIYRFRHARPDLFAGYIGRSKADAGCAIIPLMRSYRMSGRVMDAVNGVFEHVWAGGVTRDAGGRPAVGYEALLPPDDLGWWAERNTLAAGDSPLEIVVCRPAPGERAEADGGRETLPVLRKKLAREIARRIALAVGEQNVWDKSLGGFRKASWRDVAVLVPKRTGSYPALEEALAEAGVPAVFEGGREYFNRGEVQDAVNLLRLLDDPQDGYALAGWLESPLSGMPPGCGVVLVVEQERTDCGLPERFAREFPSAAGRLERLRRKAQLCGASAAMLELLEEDGWIAAYRPEARERVIANLRFAVGIVRDFEASMGKSLAACADYLGREMRAFAPAEEPASAYEADAVRVMTVHASKGLEFPVVVLTGMESTPKSRSGHERAQVSRSIGVTFSKLPGDEDAHSAPRHRFLDSLEEWEEYERQMYVAMTRAQERLICAGILTADDPGDSDDGADGVLRRRSWLEWLLSANEARKLGFPTTEVVEMTDETAFSARDSSMNRTPETPGGVPGRLRLPEAAQARVTLSRLSASAYALFSWCPYAYRLRYRQGLELKWEMPDGDGYGGADLGSLAHWVLTRWDFEEGTLRDYLPAGQVHEPELRVVPPYLRHVYRSPRNREILSSWLTAFAQGDTANLLRTLKAGGALRQEVQFRVPYAGLSLVGGIDVYWEDASGIHIRDWKITREERSVRELYDEQIRFYALACHLLRPEVRVDAGLIHLRPAGEADLTEMADLADLAKMPGVRAIDDWEALDSRVRTMAAEAISGPCERRLDRCGRCPFSRVCYTSTGVIQ